MLKFMHNSLALATAGRSTDEFDEIPTVGICLIMTQRVKRKWQKS
jgi:hypothetical protein